MSQNDSKNTPISAGNTIKRKLQETSPIDRNEQTDLVGNVAVGDLLKMMEAIMDNKLKNLSTKADIVEVKEQINNIDDNIEALKQENKELRDEIEQMKKERIKDHLQTKRLLDQNKRKNVIFRGLVKQDNPKKTVEHICKDIMKLATVKINMARIIYTDKNNKISVVAELETEEMAISIFKNLETLAGTTIKVEKDLNEERQQDRKVMFQLKSEIISKDKTHKVFVKNDALKIGTKWLTWNPKKQLMCGKQEAEVVLAELYGNGIKSININYNVLLEKINSKN